MAIQRSGSSSGRKPNVEYRPWASLVARRNTRRFCRSGCSRMARISAFEIPLPRNSGRTKTSIKYANTARSETTRANATCRPLRYAPKHSEFFIDRSMTLRRRPLAQYEFCRNSHTTPTSRRAGSVEMSSVTANAGSFQGKVCRSAASPPRRRRTTHQLLEGPAERRLRFVANSAGDRRHCPTFE